MTFSGYEGSEAEPVADNYSIEISGFIKSVSTIMSESYYMVINLNPYRA